MSDEQTLAERVAQWAESPKGKRELCLVVRRIRIRTKALEKAMRVDPKTLDEMITI